MERAFNKIPRYDIKIIIGDMNAMVGKEESFREITGGHSKHEIANENGIQLIEFASEMEMKIMSTFFQRKEIHKGTWVSPNGNHCNQIDHILIEKRHSSLIKDVKSRRGAIAESDHFLVVVKLKEKVPRNRISKEGKIMSYDMEALKNNKTKTKFEKEIEEMLSSVKNTKNINKKWETIEETICSASNRLLGKNKKKTHKKWFDEECREAMEKKQLAGIRLVQNRNEENEKIYREEKNYFKKVCRNKKRNLMDEKLEQMEDKYKNKCIKNFYQDVKKQKNGSQQRTTYIHDKKGQLVTGDGKLNRWKEYFNELLKDEDETNESEPIPRRAEVNVGQVELPSNEEIMNILMNLKDNKSAGENGITAEIYKNGGKELHAQLCKVIQEAWEKEELPERWKDAVLCPIYKKGERVKCENYRGIALLDVAYKIFAVCIRNRLREVSEEIVGEYQAGFRKDRSTTDQIFSLKQIIANSYEHKLPLQILFIDFKQAYDTIKKHQLYEILNDLQIPGKLISLIKATQKETRCKVTVDGKVSDSFEVERGLRQGDPISPLLFNLVLEYIIRKANMYTKGTIYQRRNQSLAYADDIAMITRTRKELENIFRNLEKAAREVGLHINESKTKYMQVGGTGQAENSVITFNMESGKVYCFEMVEAFDYLGVVVTNNNSESVEIETRILKGRKCVGSLHGVLKSKNVSRGAKIKLYKTVIRPTVLYGCELWCLKQSDQKRLEVWERKVLRKIFGGKKEGEIVVQRTNSEVMDLYGNYGITGIIKAQRLRWLGHITRMSEDRTVKKIFKGGINKTKRRGRPKAKWSDAVLKDLKTLKITKWEEKATDRRQWKNVCNQAMGLQGLEC